MMPTVTVHETISALEEAAADFIASRANSAIRDRGTCSMSLSGGETPRGVYRRLASSPHRELLDWTRIHICFGDERLVPPDDPRSNYGMANEELLSRVPLPRRNVHRIHGEFSPEDAERDYAVQLRSLPGGGSEALDLVLLGVGEDGHTASLFPGNEVLDEQGADTRAVYVPQVGAWRVTMTSPRLNNARDILFLAAGERKAAIVQRVLGARQPDRDLPATMVRPANGMVRWMLDREAAAALP